MQNRPKYCPCFDESIDPCPACGATVAGNDPVNGVCQAELSAPMDYGLRITLVDKNTGRDVFEQPNVGNQRPAQQDDGRAQAQPPANQDKPVYAISRSMHSYYTQDEEEARQAEFDGANVQRIPAQPPAASVPEMTGLTWEPPNVTVDVERVGRFRSGDEHIVIVTFRSSDDGRRMTCFYSANKSAAEYLHAMLAAQENPNG